MSVARIESWSGAGGTAPLVHPGEIVLLHRCPPGRHSPPGSRPRRRCRCRLPEGPLAWRCIEILPVAGDGPRVRLTGAVRETADRAGVGEIRVSLSHCDEYATAVATVDVAR